jgi:hypothetical protein
MIQTRKYVSRQEQQSQQSTWHIEPTTSATFCIDVDKHFMPKAEYFEHFCSDVLNPHHRLCMNTALAHCHAYYLLASPDH